MKTFPDLNLLVVLDALISEGSVTKAATRLNISTPAASRALSRLRIELSDEIMVRSGRGLTPTAKAIALHERVHRLIEELSDVAFVEQPVDLSLVHRDFRVATNDSLICYMVGPILELTRTLAPNVRVSFIAESMETVSLRDSPIDLELGILHNTEPEVHRETVFTDRFIGVARAGHPIFDKEITLDRYLAATHLSHSRAGNLHGKIDEQLAKIGRTRTTISSTPTVGSSFITLLNTDLISTCLERLNRKATEQLGLNYFELPEEIIPRSLTGQISIAWHPKHDSDPVHTWFRACILQALQEIP